MMRRKKAQQSEGVAPQSGSVDPSSPTHGDGTVHGAYLPTLQRFDDVFRSSTATAVPMDDEAAAERGQTNEPI